MSDNTGLMLINDIYRARRQVLSRDPKPPVMRILMHPETCHELCRSSEFADMMRMQGYREYPELFGMKVIETSAVEGWELVVVEPQ